ncbi:hypothetical protein RclHR1_02420002 [Rhizophagus clarus]|uniref:F-box domain-containing protein n=1 Tax=Rhizophagus clarus TaxID=94130 RepID=A0A2Z6QYW9_9GLOM|nr:hypothetical protein RclHR1_02420002 [Rhizophagus clarus]
MNFLENTLSHLEDDLYSLYSCLLVNRYWSQHVIPLLWSQPFELVKETSSHKIIITYISCLPKETKKRFRIGGIKLPNYERTLFDYPKYLKNFNTQKFCRALNKTFLTNTTSPQYFYSKKSKNKFSNIIRKQIKLFKGFYIIYPKNNFDKSINKCFKPILKQYYSTYPNPYLAKEIIYLLFNQYITLKSLIINTCLDNRYKMDIELHLFLQRNHNSLQNLSTFELDFVKKLSYNREWKKEDFLLTELLNKMSEYAINLRKIRIEIPFSDPWGGQRLTTKFHQSLRKLIESQTKLKIFISNYYWDQTESCLYESLTKQSNTLKRLTLMELTHSDHRFRKGLSSWKNLETLELLGGSDFLTPSNVELEQLSIKNLFIGQNYEPDPLISKILKATNKNLNKLVLDGSSNSIIFETIIKYCPKITHLSITLSLDNYNYIILLLPKLFSNLYQLKYLKLSSREINKKSEIFESLLKVSKSFPLSLQHLVLELNMYYLNLDYFLKQCHHYLIYLDIIYNNIIIQDELFLTLMQYKKDNNNCQKIRFFSSLEFPYNLDLDFLDDVSEYITFVKEKYSNFNINNLW